MDTFLRWVLAPVLGALVARLQHVAEIERSTDALTVEGQRQIGLQYDTAGDQDLKTMGMVAAALAGTALISATQHEWSGWWAPPLLVLLASVGCFVKSLWQRQFKRGPKVPKLYRTYTGTLLDLKGDILQELVMALEHNAAQLPAKGRWYARGCWCLAVGSWATALVLVLQLYDPVVGHA